MISYTTNEYGLREKDMDYMQQIFGALASIEKVILFGSRARGDFERGADVDLAVTGEHVSTRDIARIHFLLENESPTLLWFDILHYDTLKDSALKKQIDVYGKVIYARGE